MNIIELQYKLYELYDYEKSIETYDESIIHELLKYKTICHILGLYKERDKLNRIINTVKLKKTIDSSNKNIR